MLRVLENRSCSLDQGMNPDCGTLNALEQTLSQTSDRDDSARAQLYLIDMLRNLKDVAGQTRDVLDWVPDLSIRAHMRQTVRSLEALCAQTQAMLEERAPLASSSKPRGRFCA